MSLIAKLYKEISINPYSDVFIIDKNRFYRNLTKNGNIQYLLHDYTTNDFIVVYNMPIYLPDGNVDVLKLFSGFKNPDLFYNFMKDIPKHELYFSQIVFDDIFLYYNINININKSDIKPNTNIKDFAESFKDDIIEYTLKLLEGKGYQTTIENVHIYTNHTSNEIYSYNVLFRRGCFPDLSDIALIVENIYEQIPFNSKKFLNLDTYHHNQEFILGGNMKMGDNKAYEYVTQFNYKGELQRRVTDEYGFCNSIISSKFSQHIRFPVSCYFKIQNGDHEIFSPYEAFNKIPHEYKSSFTISSIIGNRINITRKGTYKCMICSRRSSLNNEQHYHDNIDPYLYIQSVKQYVYYFCPNILTNNESLCMKIGCLQPIEIYDPLGMSFSTLFQNIDIVPQLISDCDKWKDINEVYEIARTNCDITDHNQFFNINSMYNDLAIISKNCEKKINILLNFIGKLDVTEKTLIITSDISSKNHIIHELRNIYIEVRHIEDLLYDSSKGGLGDLDDEIMFSSTSKLTGHYKNVIIYGCESCFRQFSDLDFMNRSIPHIFENIIKSAKRVTIIDSFFSKRTSDIFNIWNRNLYIMNDCTTIISRRAKNFTTLELMYNEIFQEIENNLKLLVIFDCRIQFDKFIANCTEKIPRLKIHICDTGMVSNLDIENSDLTCLTNITSSLGFSYKNVFDAIYIQVGISPLWNTFQIMENIINLKENYIGYHITDNNGNISYMTCKETLLNEVLKSKDNSDLSRYIPIESYTEGMSYFHQQLDWKIVNYVYNKLDNNLTKMYIHDIFDFFLDSYNYDKLSANMKSKLRKMSKTMIDTKEFKVLTHESFNSLNKKASYRLPILNVDDKISLSYYIFNMIFNEKILNNIVYRNLYFNLYHYDCSFRKRAHFCYLDKNNLSQYMIYRNLRNYYRIQPNNNYYKHKLVDDLCKNLGMNNSFQYMKIDKYDFLLNAEYLIENYTELSKYFPILCENSGDNNLLDITHPVTCISYLNNIFSNYSNNRVKSDGVRVQKILKHGYIDNLKIQKKYNNSHYGNVLKGRGVHYELYDCIFHGNPIYNYIDKRPDNSILNQEEREIFLHINSPVNDRVDENYYPPDHIDNYFNDLYDKLRKIVTNEYPTDEIQLNEYIRNYANELIINDGSIILLNYRDEVMNRIRELISLNYPKCYINNIIEKYIGSIRNNNKPTFIIRS